MKSLNVHQFIAWIKGIAEWSDEPAEAAEYARVGQTLIEAQKFNFGGYDKIPPLDWPQLAELMEGCPASFRLPYPNVLFFFEGRDAVFLHAEPIGEGVFRARMWWFDDERASLKTGPWAAHIDTTVPEHRFKAVRFLGDESVDVMGGTREEQESFSYTILLTYSCLAVLNAANVETVEVPAIDPTRQYSRTAPALPLYSYKTLHIAPGRTSAKTQGANPPESSRNAPRIHLRRGHLRRIGSKVVWVQPCVVGNARKGIVRKDYRVKR